MERYSKIGSLSRILRRASTAPYYVIVTDLPVEQCRLRLTGRKRVSWFGDSLVKPLGLRGKVFRDYLTLRMPSHAIFGEFQSRGSGTQIILRVSNKRADAMPILDLTLMALLVAIPFVVYDWLWNQSLPKFQVLPAVILGFGWFRELRIRWSRFPRTPDDAARMLAGLVDGTIENLTATIPRSR